MPGLSGQTASAVATGLRPDVLLLQKAQAGDRGAYGQIVVLYQDRLYNAVLRLVGDREEARELTQEAFTRGLEKIDSFRGDASPYTWLFRIGVNLAISQIRKVRRIRVFSLDRPGAWCRQVAINLVRDGWRRRRSEEAAIGRLRHERAHTVPAPRSPSDEFWAAVRALPARQREAIALYYLADRSVAEIASTLGIADGTVKGILFDARRALAARLGVREDWEES